MFSLTSQKQLHENILQTCIFPPVGFGLMGNTGRSCSFPGKFSGTRYWTPGNHLPQLSVKKQLTCTGWTLSQRLVPTSSSKYLLALDQTTVSAPVLTQLTNIAELKSARELFYSSSVYQVEDRNAKAFYLIYFKIRLQGLFRLKRWFLKFCLYIIENCCTLV